jgi:hypothetical protein
MIRLPVETEIFLFVTMRPARLRGPHYLRYLRRGGCAVGATAKSIPSPLLYTGNR